MPIIAALISRGTTVLVEYCPPGNSFPQLARRLVEQIPTSPDSKKSYSYESYNFNYLVEGGIIYLCMSDQDLGLRVPYAFLFDINNRFKATYGQKVLTAQSMAMNDTFSRVLKERIEFFGNDKNDKINNIKAEIDDAKQVMVKNIDKVLERGERIEVLVDKTEELHSQSMSFKTKSTKLKRKMWWQNAKMCCILICIVTVIIAAIVLIILWKFGILNDITHHHSTGKSTESATTTSTTSGSVTTGIHSTSGALESFAKDLARTFVNQVPK